MELITQLLLDVEGQRGQTLAELTFCEVSVQYQNPKYVYLLNVVTNLIFRYAELTRLGNVLDNVREYARVPVRVSFKPRPERYLFINLLISNVLQYREKCGINRRLMYDEIILKPISSRALVFYCAIVSFISLSLTLF